MPASRATVWRPPARGVWSACSLLSLLPLSNAKCARKRPPASVLQMIQPMSPESNTPSSPLQSRPPGTQPLSAPQPATHHLACRPSPLAIRYALSKGLGVWELIFEGWRVTLKDEMGVPYVAWLLLNQPKETKPPIVPPAPRPPPTRQPQAHRRPVEGLR
ncbi:hypothetical protein SBV1_270067 [Verrucomicrobia bacterium]|nr:hypothetical protein SBV1_270067 [Verrucomicrobiota bacterium]